jgi:hypothetical protein
MTVALRSPYLVKNLVSVDNAPVDAALRSDFAKYARGMQKIEEGRVTKQSEADEILRDFEEVRVFRSSEDVHWLTIPWAVAPYSAIPTYQSRAI